MSNIFATKKYFHLLYTMVGVLLPMEMQYFSANNTEGIIELKNDRWSGL